MLTEALAMENSFSKQGNDLVSVVMCTYNGSSFVEEQLRSILSQSYSNLEVIIADDASTDDTFSLLEPYTLQDERILLYRNEKNLGYNLNFSVACSKTSGAYIAIADQDDIWEEDKIRLLLEKMDEDEQTVMVHAKSARFETRNKPHLKSLELVNYFEGNDLRLFYLSNFISGHSMLFRSSLLQQSLPFPGHVYYDWWLAAQACVHGEIKFVDEVLVWHRMHETNATGAAKPRIPFFRQVQSILPTILSIPGIAPAHLAFGRALLEHYQVFPGKSFSWPLFRFLLDHADVVFSYKKRKFPLISYVKYAWKYARRSTLA